MKVTKTLTLLFAIIMLSCSSSDDNSDSNSESCINPPEWLIGTWIHYNGNVEENKYIFSQDNIISYDYDISTDLRQSRCGRESQGVTTEQEYTSEYYLFRWTLTSGGTSIPNNLYFFKIDDSTMKFSNWSDGEPSITFEKQ